MAIPYEILSWIQNGEPASGGEGGSSVGVSNRPLVELLANDLDIQAQLNMFTDGNGNLLPEVLLAALGADSTGSLNVNLNWGDIIGDINAQTDLMGLLNAKEDSLGIPASDNRVLRGDMNGTRRWEELDTLTPEEIQALIDAIVIPEVVDATPAVKGIIRIATNPEAAAYALNTIAMTPYNLDAAMQLNQVRTEAEGRQEFPGGLVFQWFTLSLRDGGASGHTYSVLKTFAQPFTSMIVHISGMVHQPLGAKSGSAGLYYYLPVGWLDKCYFGLDGGEYPTGPYDVKIGVWGF